MTREEEIKKIASAFAIDEVKDTCNPASKRGLLYVGFVTGAEWADRTMIDKACSWLLEWETHQGEDIEVVEQFKQAMKGSNQ